MTPETIEETTDGGLPCTPCSASFAEFPKMARLSRECIITEKIDGTMADAKDCRLLEPASEIDRIHALQAWAKEGLGWPQEITAEDAVNTLRHIADDHPCCAVSLLAIIGWLETICPHCGQSRTYCDGWNCPTEGCDSLHNDSGHPAALSDSD